jgi:hypothetical protein
MKVLSLLSFCAGAVGLCAAANDVKDPYVYGQDPKRDAEYDVSMGMAGIQQATKDPKMLAQLFEDMKVRRMPL